MNLELFSDSKWAILNEISNNPQSPLDLSKKFDTTISNMSQQLKILEYSGLVSKRKEKTKRVGKAKSIYSLKDNKTYLISINSNGARKKELKKTPHQTLTANVWLYAKEDDKYFIEKFFWENENLIEDSKLILLKKNSNSIVLDIILNYKPKQKTIIKKIKTCELKINFLNDGAHNINCKDYVVLLNNAGILICNNSGEAQ